jgi:hypothetical protein
MDEVLWWDSVEYGDQFLRPIKSGVSLRAGLIPLSLLVQMYSLFNPLSSLQRVSFFRVLGPTGVKCPGHETDHSLPNSAGAKKTWINSLHNTCSWLSVQLLVVKHKENFACRHDILIKKNSMV